jgi:hypothetical protein
LQGLVSALLQLCSVYAKISVIPLLDLKQVRPSYSHLPISNRDRRIPALDWKLELCIPTD